MRLLLALIRMSVPRLLVFFFFFLSSEKNHSSIIIIIVLVLISNRSSDIFIECWLVKFCLDLFFSSFFLSLSLFFFRLYNQILLAETGCWVVVFLRSLVYVLMTMVILQILLFILANCWDRKKIYVGTSNVKAIVLVNPIGMSKPHNTHGYFFLLLLLLYCRFLLHSIL